MILPDRIVDQVERVLGPVGVRLCRAGETPITPCAVLGMPTYEWQSFGADMDPSELSARVVLLADAGTGTVAELGAMLAKVAPALDQADGFTVRAARPAVYNAPGGALPAYEVDVVLDPEEDW